ncbi:hypothetical protein NP493_3769g00000 [Ridgeia piscesae]|uniref:Reverse transcriptase domain-containing protein n=1 Tax=Ridgeia piscesae TaxID=27915 RepID=A0AAD9MW57_RIDPI|nr:hypothetical protein NP493_3769g00000 [Ridgeia piscesae]
MLKELKRMIEIYVIEKVDQPTDWVNSVVYVTKPPGELRICLYPKDLNNYVRRPHHYTQVIDDILPQLQGASVFSILDARSGYWNVKLDDQSKLCTTFNTPYGRYCFRRLPFGLVSAQDVFQKKVYQTFEGLPGVVAIADDIVVFGNNEAEHDEHMNNAMKRTQEVGLCLNPDKCVVKSHMIKSFGNNPWSKGLEPDPDKPDDTVDNCPGNAEFPCVNQYCDKWIATVPKSMSRGHSAVLELQRYVDIVKKTLQKAKREKTPPSLCSVFVRLPSKQDYRHLQKCYLAERFSPTYPSSPPRGKRKHVFTEENNGDDIMMNMHVT